ncbi:MAG: hypothetical protein GY906_10070 [bacterium]|nr:hypothetical protein [bacterium]
MNPTSRLEAILVIVAIGGAYGFGLMLRDMWLLVRRLKDRRTTIAQHLEPWTNRTGDN